MKLFKEVEILLNIIILLLFPIIFLFTESYELLFVGIILTACLHAISITTHIATKLFLRNKIRIAYSITFVLLSAAFSFWQAAFFIIVLLASPFFILAYISISHSELQTLKFKEFVHIK